MRKGPVHYTTIDRSIGPLRSALQRDGAGLLGLGVVAALSLVVLAFRLGVEMGGRRLPWGDERQGVLTFPIQRGLWPTALILVEKSSDDVDSRPS